MEQSLRAYINQHKLEDTLQELINHVLASRTPSPYVAMQHYLEQIGGNKCLLQALHPVPDPSSPDSYRMQVLVTHNGVSHHLTTCILPQACLSSQIPSFLSDLSAKLRDFNLGEPTTNLSKAVVTAVTALEDHKYLAET
ncbi:hypothetical protein KIPB_011051, partial [Kipferlia bialata]|eukprot:g11051.t1